MNEDNNNEVQELRRRLSLEYAEKEQLKDEVSSLTDELEQMRLIYVTTMDYATALEEDLGKKIEKLTHKKLSFDDIGGNDNTQLSSLRQKISLQASKIEHLSEINKNLLEQVEKFRLLYVNTMEHATVLENELDEKYQEVSRLSVTDNLTHLNNRTGFIKSWEAEIEKMTRKGYISSLIMFDIDHFKEINDNYGHDIGDIILKEISNTVGTFIRKGDIFARWGGEEFLVLVQEMGIERAVPLAERIRVGIETANFSEVKRVTCSFGVTDFKYDDKRENVIKRADLALYTSKNAGRNKVSIN